MVVATLLLEKLGEVVLTVQDALESSVVRWSYWASSMRALET